MLRHRPARPVGHGPGSAAIAGVLAAAAGAGITGGLRFDAADLLEAALLGPVFAGLSTLGTLRTPMRLLGVSLGAHLLVHIVWHLPASQGAAVGVAAPVPGSAVSMLLSHLVTVLLAAGWVAVIDIRLHRVLAAAVMSVVRRYRTERVVAPLPKPLVRGATRRHWLIRSARWQLIGAQCHYRGPPLPALR